jgi:hypothetical protein
MEDGTSAVYKLGQKIRPDPKSPATVMLTNIYLSEAEVATLAVLEGNTVTKTRWRWAHSGGILAVDQFQGHLTGLVLAELELEAGEGRYSDPPLAVAEVTEDDRFSGGSLSRTSDEGLRTLLKELNGHDLCDRPPR